MLSQPMRKKKPCPSIAIRPPHPKRTKRNGGLQRTIRKTRSGICTGDVHGGMHCSSVPTGGLCISCMIPARCLQGYEAFGKAQGNHEASAKRDLVQNEPGSFVPFRRMTSLMNSYRLETGWFEHQRATVRELHCLSRNAFHEAS